jgi:hypothetical protein
VHFGTGLWKRRRELIRRGEEREGKEKKRGEGLKMGRK